VIAGIDFSTHAVDVILLDEDTGRPRWHRRRLDTGPGDAFNAALRVRDAMPVRGAWRDSGVTLIAIERPWSRQLRSIAVLMRIQGAILATLPPQLPILELHPQTWKRETVGKSNASKAAVAAWARAELILRCGSTTVDGWPQDAFDAYAIARAAQALNDRSEAA
jgi:Holliday junction resolvasome RuvABC endonuclease subunit